MSDYGGSQERAEHEEASPERTDLLSGAEIDDLLDAVGEEANDKGGELETGTPEEYGSAGIPENGSAGTPVNDVDSSEQPRRVKIYDFLRPDRFSPEEIELLADLGNDYVDRLRERLPMSLQNECTIRLESVDQLRADEYARGIGDPDTIALISALSYPPFYLEFSLSAMRLLLAGLIGMTKPLSGESSITESPFFRRLVELFLRRTVLPALSGSWESRACFPYSLERIFYSPAELVAVASYEMLLVLTLRIEGPAGFEAASTVAIPHRLGEELIPVLAGEVEGSTSQAGTGTVTEGLGAGRRPRVVPVPEEVRVSARPDFPLLGVNRTQLEKWHKGSSIRLRAGYSGRYI